jgi:hypothetical protein
MAATDKELRSNLQSPSLVTVMLFSAGLLILR